MKVLDRKTEYEAERDAFLQCEQWSKESAIHAIGHIGKNMVQSLKLIHWALLRLKTVVRCSLQRWNLYAKFLLGLKLKRGRIVSCFPESRVPFIFPPNDKLTGDDTASGQAKG